MEITRVLGGEFLRGAKLALNVLEVLGIQRAIVGHAEVIAIAGNEVDAVRQIDQQPPIIGRRAIGSRRAGAGHDIIIDRLRIAQCLAAADVIGEGLINILPPAGGSAGMWFNGLRAGVEPPHLAIFKVFHKGLARGLIHVGADKDEDVGEEDLHVFLANHPLVIG